MTQGKIIFAAIRNTHLILLQGNLYADCDADKLRNILTSIPSTKENPAEIIIDMAKAGFLSSKVVGAFFKTADQAKKNDKPIQVRGLSTRNKELFEIIGLINFVELVSNPPSFAAQV